MLPWCTLLSCLWSAATGPPKPKVALRNSDKLAVMHMLCYAPFAF